jgi:hypothetical protein
MAQTTLDSNQLLPAMAISLASIVAKNVTVSEVGLLGSEAFLLAPFYNDRKIVLDLTPGDDDWLEILGANGESTAHHEGEATQALHVAVRLSDDTIDKLNAIEKKIRTIKGYSILESKAKAWYGMHRGGGKVILNIVMDDSATLTPLRFLQGGQIKKGFGKAFLDQCLDGANLKDFYCKAKVEMECIHEAADNISILLTVHSVIFAPVPKRTIIDFTADEEAAVIRAAKRLKYKF